MSKRARSDVASDISDSDALDVDSEDLSSDALDLSDLSDLSDLDVSASSASDDATDTDIEDVSEAFRDVQDVHKVDAAASEGRDATSQKPIKPNECGRSNKRVKIQPMRVHTPFTLFASLQWTKHGSKFNSKLNRCPRATRFARVHESLALAWQDQNVRNYYERLLHAQNIGMAFDDPEPFVNVGVFH